MALVQSFFAAIRRDDSERVADFIFQPGVHERNLEMPHLLAGAFRVEQTIRDKARGERVFSGVAGSDPRTRMVCFRLLNS